MAYARHYIKAALKDMEMGGSEIAGESAAHVRQLMRWAAFAANDATDQINETLERKDATWKRTLG